MCFVQSGQHLLLVRSGMEERGKLEINLRHLENHLIVHSSNIFKDFKPKPSQDLMQLDASQLGVDLF
jgi:hypothetical protein